MSTPVRANDLTWQEAMQTFNKGNFGRCIPRRMPHSDLIIIISYGAEPNVREVSLFKVTGGNYPQVLALQPCRQLDVDLFFRLNMYTDAHIVFRPEFVPDEEIMNMAIQMNRTAQMRT